MEKKSTGKTVVIVILLLALLGLGGYVVYDKFINVKESEESDVKEEAKVEETGFDLSKNRVIQNTTFQYGQVGGNVVVSKDGSVYVNFYDKEEGTDTKTKASLANMLKQYQDYMIEDYFSFATEEGDSQAFKGIKLPVDNVIAAYEGYSGNGGLEGWYLYLVKTDGTISGFSMGDTFEVNNGQIKFENNKMGQGFNLSECYAIE